MFSLNTLSPVHLYRFTIFLFFVMTQLLTMSVVAPNVTVCDMHVFVTCWYPSQGKYI